jgi:ABC-type bacteriocin/lantibiotic exporter with double-glycine peptidase domain
MNSLRHTWQIMEIKEKRRFLFLALLDIFVSVADIVSLAILLGIVQFYIQPINSARFSFLPAWLTSRDSFWGIALFFIFFCLKNWLAIAVTRWQFDFTGKVAVRISGLRLSRFQDGSFAEFIQVDSSVHIRAIAFQPFEVSQYLLAGMQQLMTQSVLITLTLTAIIIFKTKIFLLLLLVLAPPVAGVLFFIKKRLELARSGIRAANERSFQHLLDALKGYVESNVYDKNLFFKRRFLHSRAQFSKHLFASLGIQSMPGRAVELFAVFGLFLLILQAQRQGNDSDTLLTIGAFMAAAYKVIPGIIKLINVTGQMKTYRLSIQETIDAKSVPRRSAASPAIELQSIEFRDVAYSYAHIPVLNAKNFFIQCNDFVGISGRSGMGKTTILNLMLGFLEPVDGSIRVNDVPLNPEGLRNCWPSIAYVRQQAFLINDTIEKNITLQEEAPDEERMRTALEISGLAGILHQLSGGLAHVLTENGKNISGGQQQRIALARAIYKPATLYLLDEPFNELDEASEIVLLKHFRALAEQGKIVVMITHDQRSLTYCNKIISLDE